MHHRAKSHDEMRWNFGALLRRLAAHLAGGVAVDDQVARARGVCRRCVLDVDVARKVKGARGRDGVGG